jgi:drug/metabolite transporter (DMT)-like permease
MAVFGKLAYDQGVAPETLVLLRFVLASALLIAIFVQRGSRRASPRSSSVPSSPTTRLTVTALALGYATQATLYFSALERMDASLVALILYTYPALVSLAAAALGRDRLTLARTAALVLASCGTLLVLGGAGAVPFDPIGVALALGSAVTYTVYILVSDVTLHRVEPLTLTTLVMTGAAFALGARSLVTGDLDLDVRPAGWFWIVCVAVVSTVVAATAFFAGLRRTGPSTASILSTFEPVATATLATLVLGEVLTPIQLLGGGLVLASAALVQLAPRPRRDVSDDDVAPGDRRVGEVRHVGVDIEARRVATDPYDRAGAGRTG